MKTTRQLIRLAAFLVICSLLASMQSAICQNLIVNGSMDGKVARHCDGNTNGTVPAGWQITASTPDVNSAKRGPVGGCAAWSGTPVASPDGGYFESILSFGSTDSSSEGFSQTVSGLTVGSRYIFSYYWAWTPSSFQSAALPAVSVTGFAPVEPLNPSDSIRAWTWTKQTVTLTATSSSAKFEFRAKTASNVNLGYISFDGVSLVKCYCGGAAPALSVTEATFKGAGVSLLSFQGGSAPFGSQFQWHTGTPGTIANMVAHAFDVGEGTYYLTYYDFTHSCFSPTSIGLTLVRRGRK